MQENKQTQQTAVMRLETLCADPNMTAALLQNLVAAVEEARAAGVTEESGSVLATAIAKMSLAQQRWSEAKEALRDALGCRPPRAEKLGQAVKKARQTGLPQDTPEVEAAVRLHKEVTSAKKQVLAALSKSYGDLQPSELSKAVQNCQCFEIPLTEKELQATAQFQKEELDFTKECSRRWGDAVAEKVQTSCQQWHQTPPPGPSVPVDEFQQKSIESALDLLICCSNSGAMRKEVDSAILMLEKPVMAKWLHVSVYLALAHASPSHIDLYRADAADFLTEYIKDTVLVTILPIDPGFLLSTARLCSADDRLFRVSCLRRCNFPQIQRLMTAEELRLAATPPCQTPSGVSGPASEAKAVAKTSCKSRWECLKQEEDSIPSPALDTIMELAGLEMVKEKALEIYSSILAEQSLPVARRVPQSFNFALLGNPGTGNYSPSLPPLTLFNECIVTH
jgi:hypothetical protein